MGFDFDLLVIGAGSGGVRASRTAAQLGKKVAVVEIGLLGGTCVNVGCVPKKIFTYAAQFASDFKDSEGYGWASNKPTFDWSTLIKNKDKEISRLNDIYKDLLKSANVKLIDGQAKFINNNSIEVEGKKYTAKTILIACGGTPFVPNIEGAELAGTSYDAFYLNHLPKDIIIVGGGYISVEFAGIFNLLGSNVTIILRGENILRSFDADVSHFLKDEMLRNNIKILTEVEPIKLEKNNIGKTEKITVHTSNGNDLTADFVMWAVGRKANTENLGLQNTDVKTRQNGSIITNDKFQTSAENIYAIGDVIDKVQLTPVALNEGIVFTNQCFGDGTKTMNYDNIASAVFSNPNIATCGLSEQQAIAENYDCAIYKSEFREMKNALAKNQTKTLMKIIVDKKTDVVLGVHMVGNNAGDIMQGIAIALKAGLKKSDFDGTIGIHPTSAEEFVTMRDPI